MKTMQLIFATIANFCSEELRKLSRMHKLHHSVLISLTALAIVSCAPKSTVSPTKNVTLIALRHADRDAGVDALNATGLVRAAALPAALTGYEINAIFSPGFHRNLQTATPSHQRSDVHFQRFFSEVYRISQDPAPSPP